MTSIREAVEKAIADEGDTDIHVSHELIVDTAITAFLEAAAKKGWQMRPDEATEEMRIANCELDCGYAACHKAVGGPQCVNHGERRKYSDESWGSMLAAAPLFEWDK